jgi:predicted DNA-binding protein
MKNTKVVSLSLELNTIQKLDYLSKESGISKSKIITKLVNNAELQRLIVKGGKIINE